MAKQYVDNKLFFEHMTKLRQDRLKAEEAGDPPPKINDYIGKCIYDIANRYSMRPNFINYPFRDEMVADGIENAIKAMNNFDPAKSANPFAYFTQIIFYAFLRRIAKEKKYLYIKQKAFTSLAILGEVYAGAGADISNQTSGSTEYMDNFVEEYEAAEERKKIPKVMKKKGVEVFYDDV